MAFYVGLFLAPAEGFVLRPKAFFALLAINHPIHAGLAFPVVTPQNTNTLLLVLLFEDISIQQEISSPPRFLIQWGSFKQYGGDGGRILNH